MDNNRKFSIATGRSRFDRTWRNESWSWGHIVAKLRDCRDTGETMAEYKAAGRERQTQLKDVGGFVGGYLRDGIRKAQNVERRSMVTLDYDTFHAGRLEDVRRALPCRWAMHSTHKHREESWRVRIVIPLSRDVSPDEYGAVARRCAERIGFEGIDRSTFEPCRLMFWPSRSTDAPFLFEEGDADGFLDVRSILNSYTDWRDQSAWPMLPEETGALRLFSEESDTEKRGKEPKRDKSGRKIDPEAERIYAALMKSGQRAEDPREKKGLVGTFCRVYDIAEAIAAFIPDAYEMSKPGRFTHVGSTTHGGAVSLDGGRFLYSFHGTDPAAGHLLNSWDLVRVHRFAHLDLNAERGTRSGRMPSFKAMEELAMSDDKVKAALAAERRAEIAKDFSGMDISDAAEDTEKPEEESPELKEWRKIRTSLPWNKDGSCKSTITAAATILMNDPAVKGKLRYNEFTGETDVTGTLPWKRSGEFWSNNDDSCLRSWFDAKYGITGKEKISDAFVKATTANAYHPIKDYLESLEWDGRKRLGRVFCDILGAEDTPLNTRLGELIFGAAVTRIYRPGVKFDFFVILQGPEGTGKSSLFELMAGKWFSDSVVSIEGKEGMEAVQGVWIAEIGELIGVKRSESAAVKSFISRTVDKFRPAYGRVREVKPRQCIVVGTTNEELFLRGISTGNRRSPVVEIRPELRKCDQTVRDWVAANRDQMWAEAVQLYRGGMKLYLTAEEEAAARKTQEAHNLDIQNPLFGEVERFLDLWIPFGWEMMNTSERQNWYTQNPDGGDGFSGNYTQRESVCIAEILREGLGIKRNDKDYISKSREVGQYLNTLPDRWKKVGGKRSKIYGVQIQWDRIKTEEVNFPGLHLSDF